MDGSSRRADKLRFAPDSTAWVDPKTQRKWTVLTAKVSDVRFVKRKKGAGEGFVLGFSTGGLTGVVIGIVAGEESGPGIGGTTGGRALMGGIFLGGLGGLIGAAVGAVRGSKDVYRIEESVAADSSERK